MDFSLTEEQSMLADSVARFIESNYNFERRQELAAREPDCRGETWQMFAELGWTALPFDEEDGGLGGGPVELMLMMEQFGRGLVAEPFLATVVLAGGVLRRTATPSQKESWLTGLMAGSIQAALAFAEPQSRFDIGDIRTTASANGDGFILNGSKAVVPNGGEADLLIVPARTSGGPRDRHGITLFALTRDTEGVERSAYSTVDAHRAAEIRLRDVRAHAGTVLGDVGAGFDVLQATIDEATLAVSAEALGIVRALHEKTVEYSKSRVQFGAPIGSFQALQHRMVDMLIACEQCKSLMLRAALLAASGGADSRKAISALKYQVGTGGRLVAQEAVQIHGGMGVSWELDIAHYFKRFSTIELLFGNADFHLDRLIALSQQDD